MAWGVLAWQVLIRIPVGTALFEETMFRGVLYGAWRRTMRWWQAAILSSVAFALWHVVVEMHRQEREGHAWGMDGLINTLLVLERARIGQAVRGGAGARRRRREP
jgi:hypothetical protein